MHKSIAARLAVAKVVIAHAADRRSRGRRPSMPFGTERNARKALELARLVVSEAEASRRIILPPAPESVPATQRSNSLAELVAAVPAPISIDVSVVPSEPPHTPSIILPPPVRRMPERHPDGRFKKRGA